MADAVVFEPVSTREFPANREINREFGKIRALCAILDAHTRANSETCSEIPYTTEQGIISEEQGILPLEQGLFDKNRNEVFGRQPKELQANTQWSILLH